MEGLQKGHSTRGLPPCPVQPGATDVPDRNESDVSSQALREKSEVSSSHYSFFVGNNTD